MLVSVPTMQLRVPDGQSLGLFPDGPRDRMPLVLHIGTPRAGQPFAHGQWLATHASTARARLYPEHGHLSLAVDSFPRIIDELLAADR